jgi:hypothetical protein
MFYWANLFLVNPYFASTHQPINPSTHQPINPSTHQPINPSTHQPNPSTHQKTNKKLKYFFPILSNTSI